MKALFFFILISANVYALDAVVTVLEAPLFKEPSRNSIVIQYVRKGDIIKVQDDLDDPRYERHRPRPEKLAELKQQSSLSDPLFKGEVKNTFERKGEFIPTYDRLGTQVYVLRTHVYVYTNEKSELDQTISSADETDYRLYEPLQPNYPLKSMTGLRGQFTIGISQPYVESFPYKKDVNSKGYSSPVDMTLLLLKATGGDEQDRFFIGFNYNLRFFENQFAFADGSDSSEKGLRMGAGVTLSYDAYKGEKNRINLYGSANFNFYNQLRIEEHDTNGYHLTTFRAYNLAPRLGSQYHRKNIFSNYDFVAGTALEFESPAKFSNGSSTFTTRPLFTLVGYIGVQQAF